MSASFERFPDAPARIKALRKDRRGYPVPWFVPWFDGLPEFRAVDPGTIQEAHRRHVCWICGERLGPTKAFVVGPMCGVNRVSAEPPSHIQCAHFAAVACPFLSRPLAKRADISDLPHGAPAGVMIERNPGVTLVWETGTYRVERERGGGCLFRMGSPIDVTFYREGRLATRAEVDESTATGLPELIKLARMDGVEAMELLIRQIQRFQRLVPEA